MNIYLNIKDLNIYLNNNGKNIKHRKIYKRLCGI